MTKYTTTTPNDAIVGLRSVDRRVCDPAATGFHVR
jgi:hypothetical protein